MSRPWQLFLAPKLVDDLSLPIDPSPWHHKRYARLPWHEWILILDFSKNLDKKHAQNLYEYTSLKYSLTGSENIRNPKHEELQQVIYFMDDLQAAILQAEPLLPEATEEMLDGFENESFADMVEAAQAVFKEALRLNQPFESWID